MKEYLISASEEALARHCMEEALKNGASGVRVNLSKSLMDLVGILNGEVDRVSHSLDRSLQLSLFVDGRFGTFSSNRLEKENLDQFIQKAVETVRMLEEDPLRSLPAPERVAHDAVSGNELELYSPSYEAMDSVRRREIALESCVWEHRHEMGKGFSVLSEECEYSDSVYDVLMLDSNGLEARHRETSFEIGCETTIQDEGGRLYESYWWDASTALEKLSWKDCGVKALRRAAAQMNPGDIPGGRYNMIVDTECASKLLTPLLTALGGYSLQQNNSFLAGSLGKQLFPTFLNILDRPHDKGCSGSRLFDSEGVATKEDFVIKNGVVSKYFLSTYMARKMNMEPTVDDCTRAVVEPIGNCDTLESLLREVGDGILVTGFNGGNSNSATGNFSYGIEGFLIKDGKRVRPLRGMLITGDFSALWNKLFLTAADARPCMTKQIPSLAFHDVDFSS